MRLTIVRHDSCASTSAVLAAMPEASAGTVVVTDCQTAGRGQRGNTWEAEPGKNLTFSILLRPAGMHAARQFELSMLVALAVADVIDSRFEAAGIAERTTVKWPNDIYVGERKICGTLIENKLLGAYIDRSIAGIGIDVNQRIFTSDAPNPVSMIHFLGSETPLEPLLEQVCRTIMYRCDSYVLSPDPDGLLAAFRSRLYRGDGKTYPFCEPGGEPFEASITDIALTGHLSLSNGSTYAFKEISFIHPAADAR